MKTTNNLIYFLAILLNGCSHFTHEQDHYKALLKDDTITDIRSYVEKAHLNKKRAYVTLSWVSFFKGNATYISSSMSHPEKFSEYPIAWTRIDSLLILIYDNKLKNFYSDSISIKKEIDLNMSNLNLLKKEDMTVEDNLPLRFIRNDNILKVDTSYLRVKLCK